MSFDEYIEAIRCSIVRPKIFYERRSCDIDINSYNLEILNLMQSNVDVQYILDPYAVAKYCVDYVLKTEAGLSKAMKDMQTVLNAGNFSLREKLRKCSSKFLNCHLMPQYEAVYYGLGIPLTKFKLASIFINTAPKERRVVFLKSVKQLRDLPPDSTEIFGKDIHTHYANRVGMADVCLAEYAAYYFKTANKRRPDKNLDSDEEQDNDDDDAVEIARGGLKRRVNPRIIRFVRYNQQQDPDNYYREQLLLFLPWRDEDKEIESDSVDWYETYTRNQVIIELNRSKLFNLPLDTLENAFDEAERNRRLLEEEEIAEFEANPLSKDQEIDLFVEVGMDRPKPNVPFSYSAPPTIDKEELNSLLRQLNAGQKEIVMHVYKCFTMNNVEANPLRIFVAGSAGVGKSMVIKTIFQLITYHLNYVVPKELRTPENIKVLLTAFSGKAAFLIGGNTLHSAFSLPFQENADMGELSAETADNLRKQIWQCKLLIIDEVSMVGSTTLSRINHRCRQLFGVDKSFGGLSVVLFGDLNQLPPVKDSLIFCRPKKSQLLEDNMAPLWDEFYLYELTEVMRQKDDLRFVNALNNFAGGTMTDDDIKLFKTREFREHQVPDKAIRLYYENADVEKYNNMKIAASTEELFECQARDTIMHIKGKGALTKKQELKIRESWQHKLTKDCGGYPFQLPLKKGIKYMITANINVSDGLVNGAAGELKDVYCDPKTNVPKLVFIDFGCPRVGRDMRSQLRAQIEKLGLSTKWTPIERRTYQLTTNYKAKDYTATRNQFPMVPCEALTIHKSQGQTYPEVCFTVKRSARLTRQLVYVALSRVTKIDGLYIIGTFMGNMKSNPTLNSSSDEMKRLRMERQLPLAFENMKNLKGLAVAYLNVQSLRHKIVDVNADNWYSRCDVLIFAETWTYPNESVGFPNFELIYRSDEKFNSQIVNSYQGKGLMCFVKSALAARVVHHIQCIEGRNHVDLVELLVDGVTIISGYRSPKFSYTSFARELFEFVNIVTTPTIVMGDFNINLNAKIDSHTERHMNDFMSLMLRLNMRNQLQSDEITHIGGSQLDVVFSNIDSLNAGVYECYFSDHKPIYAVLTKSKANGWSICKKLTLDSNTTDAIPIDTPEDSRMLDGMDTLICQSVSDDSFDRASIPERCNNCDFCRNRLLNSGSEEENESIPISDWFSDPPVRNDMYGDDRDLEDILLTKLSACLENQSAITANSSDFDECCLHITILEQHTKKCEIPRQIGNDMRNSVLQDYREVQMTGDGNCQFYSISYLLTGTDSHHKGLRLLAFECVWQEREFFQFLESEVRLESGSLIELLKICCTDRAWGNTDTLIAFSLKLCRRICVYSTSGGGLLLVDIKPRTISQGIPIILNLRGSHYNALLPRNGDASVGNPTASRTLELDLAQWFEEFERTKSNRNNTPEAPMRSNDHTESD